MAGADAARRRPPQSRRRPAAECELPEPTDDDTISILGRICDRRETPPVAVRRRRRSPSRTTPATSIGEATTGATAPSTSTCPGTAIEHLGKTYTVKLDESTLPEGTEPDDARAARSTINLDNDRPSRSRSATPAPAAPASSTEALQLAVGGIVFSVLLAMAALGLSMIFGTTGLTNFAHGELITFGALVAFVVDQLPGTITIGGTNITVIVAVIVAFVVSGAFGWLNDAALWRPLRRRGTGLIAMMIVSIGLSIFLRNIYQYFAGAQTQQLLAVLGASRPGRSARSCSRRRRSSSSLLGARWSSSRRTRLLQCTRLGKATRAVADNPALAVGDRHQRRPGHHHRLDRRRGARRPRRARCSGMTQGFDYQLGFKLLLLVFAAVVLGGLGTIWGAIVGAFIIGLFIELSTLFVPAELKFVGALSCSSSSC